MAYNFIDRVISLKSLNKFMALLVMMPYFNFEKGNLQFSTIHKIYSVTLSIFYMMFWCPGILQRVKETTTLFLVPHAVLMAIFEVFCLMIIVYSILSTTFWNSMNWKILLNLSVYVENYLQIVHFSKSKLTKKFCCMNLLYFGAMLTNTLLWPHKFDMYFYLNVLIHYYIFVLHTVTIHFLTKNILFKFEKIRNCLELFCNQQLHWKIDNFIIKVRNLSKITRSTFRIINLFNQIFGWQLIMSVIVTILLLMSGFNFVAIYFFFN